MPHVTPEKLYQVALKKFPHKLQAIPHITGKLQADETGFIEYSAKYRFIAGKLVNEEITAIGFIEMRQDNTDDDLQITAYFDLQHPKAGTFGNNSILSQDFALRADYDLVTQTWEFYFDWIW